MARPVPLDRQVAAVATAFSDAVKEGVDSHVEALESALSTLEALRDRAEGVSQSEEHAFVVSLHVKGHSRNAARSKVTDMLNRWFLEDARRQPPYPTGTLLLWSFRNPANPTRSEGA